MPVMLRLGGVLLVVATIQGFDLEVVDIIGIWLLWRFFRDTDRDTDRDTKRSDD